MKIQINYINWIYTVSVAVIASVLSSSVMNATMMKLAARWQTIAEAAQHTQDLNDYSPGGGNSAQGV